MRTIEIDEDIYKYLLSKTEQIGESATSILRRELKLDRRPLPTNIPSAKKTHELSELLTNAELRFGSVTDRFLAVLAIAYQQKPEDFEKLLLIKGRNRVYFARSREEIARSGRSTQPLQIPGTPFWVMTNSPTPQKKKLLAQALAVLGYSEAAQVEAAKMISLSTFSS